MPEMTFEVRWPDGRLQSCYSPSLVIHDYLTVGASYPVAEFVDRSSTALAEAGARVRAKFGFMCTSAAATAAEIIHTADKFESTAAVQVTAMLPPLEKT